MTAQASDSVLYNDLDWSLAGVNGPKLFDPNALGFKLRPAHTACWRGYICTYAVRDDALLLEHLVVAHEGEPLALFGHAPRLTGNDAFSARYEGVSAILPFTGSLLLARGFRGELYVHMGFHPAWKYEHIVELELEEGQVTQAWDCTEAMAQVRARLAGKDKPCADASAKEMGDWIKQKFSRRY